jgi:hypothetical protein
MKHLISIRDWKEEFPIEDALACYQKWGKLYVVEAETDNDAIAWVFTNQMIDERAATKIFKKELRTND